MTHYDDIRALLIACPTPSEARDALRALLNRGPLETRRALVVAARAAALQGEWDNASLDAVASLLTDLEAPRGGVAQRAAQTILARFKPATVATVAASEVIA